jgi:phenylacetic acid degradation operon negative regulatory protein
MLVLPPNGAKHRDSIKDGLRWLGFGQLSPGVFAHPNSNLEQARQWLRDLDVTRNVMLLRSSSGDVAVDRAVVAAGWDLGELARRYRRFVDSFAAVGEALASPDALTSKAPTSEALTAEAAFVIRTLLIHDYRKIHLQDPLLPPVLLPDDWVGSTAYELCASLYARVFGAAEAFLTSTASTLDEALPPAEPAAYERFGSLKRASRSMNV